MWKNKRKTVEFVGSMLASAIFFLIIYKLIPIVYSTNDDRMIAEIISGQFTGTPEAYAIQMTYGFTWFLSKLYKITRSINWYGIVLISSQIFSFGAILYRLQSFTEYIWKKLLLWLTAMAVFAAVWLKVYVQMTYTSTAAFVGLAAIFWYATSKTKWKNGLMVGFLANLAFSIRPNVFYMLLPATGLVYLWKLIGKKELDVKTITMPFVILSVTACLFVVHMTAYSQTGWKEFMEFFNHRTDIYDFYDLASYDERQELYEPYGIDKTEYDMIRVYNYTVMGELPKEFFPEYIEAYQEMEKAEGITIGTKAVEAVKSFAGDVFAGSYGRDNTIVFIAAAVLFVLLLWKKNFMLAAYLGIQCAANSALWLYFNYWGRTIDRIQISMSLIFLSVVLHVLYEMKNVDCNESKSKSRWLRMAVLLSGCCLAGLAVWNFMDYRYENIEKAHRYTDVQTIKEYCAENPERLYYMDVATMTELYGRFTIKNTEPEYINYIQLGDWSAYCPHYEEKLKHHGVENVAASITEENTYVIMLHNYQVQCMKDYLNVEESWEETIFGANDTAYAVYQFH